jgi:DNA repair photolyase
LEAFERRILVKRGADRVLARTLKASKVGGLPIVIGTATDPYQPAERRFGLTRRILETLVQYRGLSVAIITKSPLVTRDLALLRRLSARNDVSVNVSLATLDPLLARRLELRSPTPRVRLEALAQLVEGGVDAGLLIAPILPGLTDGARDLARLVDAARAAGAKWAMGSTLRLGPAARARFLPYLEDVFPELAERYRRHYARRTRAAGEYRDAVQERLEGIKRARGFADRPHHGTEATDGWARGADAQTTLL